MRTSPGATQYTEDGKPRAVDAALKIKDANDSHLERASVRIGAGLQPGDELLFKNRRAITATYKPGAGVLTLTGHATEAGYQDALRSVRFRTAHENPRAHRTIAFRVSDGEATSTPATKTIDVARTNDAPTAIVTGGFRYYTEGDGPQRVDPALSLVDPDSRNLSGATVRVAGNHVPADDRLSFSGVVGISGSYDTSTGVLTLKGTASRGTYETALRSVRYENLSQDPHGLKPISFRVSDAGSPTRTSNTAVRVVKVFPDDDGPVMTTSGGSTTYDVSDAAPVAVDPELTLDDVDDANIWGARVRFAAGFEKGDALSFAEEFGISGSYDADRGVLLLTGLAAKGDYEAALRSVTFSTSNKAPNVTTKTVEFEAYDGDAPSNLATKDIVLVP